MSNRVSNVGCPVASRGPVPTPGPACDRPAREPPREGLGWRHRAPEVTREWPADGHRRDWLSPLVVGLVLALLAIPVAALGLGLGWCLLVGVLAGLLVASGPRKG